MTSRSSANARRRPRRPARRKGPSRLPTKVLAIAFVALLAAVAVWSLTATGIVEAPILLRSAPTPVPEPTATPGPPPLSAEEQALLVRVDKQHPLPADYVPPDLAPVTGIPQAVANQRLRQVALAALQRMASEAQAEGHTLFVSSAYRSYAEQEVTHAFWVSRLGPFEAARISARAGHSEHQLGTTVDLTSASVNFDLVEAFGATPEGRWLAENAHRFGFVLSYPEGKEHITGYAYEPWHWRYIGETMATWLWERGLTLTEWQREGH
jgi:D-alanyl-D-alanine carboxypeptidase